MTIFRALGVKVLERRAPARAAEEEKDLSTFTARKGGGIHPDALAVSPPREHWTELKKSIPGTLVRGVLPDDPLARYLLRVPKKWNGSLVVAAAPGVVSEHGNDVYWSDFLLKKGYAFASTDKGAALALAGETMYVPLAPGNLIGKWFGRLKALALFSAKELEGLRGKKPVHTYVVGMSNGGWLARKACEEAPHLFDGGVDVSGVLWRADSSLLDQLARALRVCRGGIVDLGALESIGFKALPGRAELFASYLSPIWELVLACFVETFDPDYRGALEDYSLEERPGSVRDGIREIENTGRLQRPLVTVYGEADPLLPPRRHFEGYAELVRSEGRANFHRMVAVKNGSHNDLDMARFSYLEPLMPAAHAAFEDLEAWS